MEGVTTAIVLFIFAGLIYPHIVKHRQQFYAALGVVLGVILFDAISHMTEGGALPRVMYVLAALLQIVAILLLVLCAGGLSVRGLAGEVSETIEVMRRGETSKEVLVPLRGEVPKAREDRPAPPVRAPQTRPGTTDSSIPLD